MSQGEEPIEIATTAAALSAEFEQVWGEKRDFASEQEYRKAASEKKQSALCLSGGGIRCASFALGVMQALAQKRVLSKFNYLSTVSGGGYIGAWLWRWIKDYNFDVARVEKELGGCIGQPIPESDQVASLRSNSNFLTPKVGFASVDFWTAVILSIRNLILNWLIFVPLVFLIVGSFNLYLTLLQASGECAATKISEERSLSTIGHHCPADFAFVVIIFVAAFGCLGYSTFYARQLLPSLNVVNPKRQEIILRLARPVFAYSLLITLLANAPFKEHTVRSLTFILSCVVVVVAFLAASFRSMRGHVIALLREALLALIVALLLAFFLVFGFWLIHKTPDAYGLVLAACLGPLWVTWSHTMQSGFYVAFRAQDFGTDTDREWLARLSALRVLYPQVWTALAVPTLVLPPLVFDHFDTLTQAVTWIVAVASGFIAVLGGKSRHGAAPATGLRQQLPRMLSFNHIISFATVMFVAALLMGFARLEMMGAEALAAKAIGSPVAALLNPTGADGPKHLLVGAHLLLLLLAFAVLRLTVQKIAVNRFSLHGLYRNRLVRAFLGSGRKLRKRDDFTGFDADDNVRLHEILAPKGSPACGSLFPIINVTMNLVRGDDLAWQERKAGPFVCTPLHCGSASLRNPNIENRTGRPQGAFVASTLYGGTEPDLGKAGEGISLGTAMTISGAAASPSMGYHTSPATALLMTLFNVRLGAWMANPGSGRESDLTRGNPSNALRPLFAEMFGLTHAQGRDVYLSDGGHFENLGLCEAVRRGCRFILVVDAAQDETCRFEDLGNAIRKISIDQNVEIEFTGMNISSRTMAKALNASAIGLIRYPETPNEPGLIVYLKPSYHTPDMPLDVRAYGEANALFPHESTIDQWYSESQFESYRRLGYFLARQLGGDREFQRLEEFFDAIREKHEQVSAGTGSQIPSGGDAQSS